MTISIREYMTSPAQLIEAHEPLLAAHQRMRAFNVRHLPVMEGGKLVGLVTARDLQIIESFKDADMRKTAVREAMTPAPFTVHAEASLDDVARTMAIHKYGSAIVVSDGRVIGIFTAADALRALVDALERLEHHAPTSTRWGHVVE